MARGIRQFRHARACLLGALVCFLFPTIATGQTRPILSVQGISDTLRLSINGTAGTSYCVQASSDLRNWLPIGVLYPPKGVYPPGGRYELTDREFVLNSQQFYRAL